MSRWFRLAFTEGPCRYLAERESDPDEQVPVPLAASEQERRV